MFDPEHVDVTTINSKTGVNVQLVQKQHGEGIRARINLLKSYPGMNYYSGSILTLRIDQSFNNIQG